MNENGFELSMCSRLKCLKRETCEVMNIAYEHD